MKILVVEADRAVAQTLEQLISSCNYAVDLAADGEAGLQMAEASEYDLLLLDVALPKLDGISLCQQLRAKGLQIPILLLTGRGGYQNAVSTELREALIPLDAGADDCVVKPFDPEELIGRVQALLHRESSSQAKDEELQNASEKLQVAEAELRQRNEDLQIAHRTIEQQRQHDQDFLEQRVAERTTELQLLYDLAPCGYHSLNSDGVFVRINETELNMLGYTQDEILGKPFSDFLTTESIQIFQENFPQFKVRGWIKDLALQMIRKDGSVLPVCLSATAIKDEAGNFLMSRSLVVDVSDRHQLEAALQSSEEQLRLALDLTHIGSWDWDLETGIATWNANHYRLFGYQPGEVEPSYQVWRDRVHPDDIAQVEQKIAQALEAQTDYEAEYRLILRDGSVRWVMGKGQGVYNELGQPVRMVGVIFDITDRKLAEAALKQSEQKLRAFFDSTFQLMGLLTIDGRVIEGNRAALDAVAADPADVVGQPFWETPWWSHFPEQQQQLRDAIARAAKGEFVRFESKHIWADGTVAFVDFSVKPVFDADGNVIMLVPEGRDITERLRVEDERKLAEQKIREQAALLDIASDAIFVRNLDHRILYWNQGAERLYGWQAAEAIGQKANELLQIDAAQLSEIMQTLLDRGEWQGEIHKMTKTGKEVIVEGRWTLVRDEVGQPISILSVDTNITEKKHLEAQFYRTQRLESLGTLASGIAHDLNNVLTPILAIAQLLRLKQANLDARSQELLKILEDSAKRGANMVSQILTFTRGTGEKRIPLQIAPLLLEVVQVVQQTFPKSIAIRANIPDQSFGLVSADPTHLHQVFMNLCVNARDAMPHGGILTLSIETCCVDEVFAQMNLDAQVGTYVLVTIADTGTGISPALYDRIFDPFFTTKEPGKGTGLGLSTVLGIVKEYGGFLQVSSKPGQGSRFQVYLPTIEGTTDEIEQTEKLLQGNGELVLIVEDDPAVQRVNQSLLENHHYTTLIANDGIEAIVFFAQHQNDIKLILMDVMMPNMDGISTIRTLQRMNPAVKIIAVSGLSTHREAVLAAGARVFLAKPYSLEDLLRNIADLLIDPSTS